MADSGTDVMIEVKVSQLDCQGCLYTRIHAHVDSEGQRSLDGFV